MKGLMIALAGLCLAACTSMGAIPKDPGKRLEFLTKAKSKLHIGTTTTEDIQNKIKNHSDIAVLPINFVWDVYVGEDYAAPDDGLGEELLECALLEEEKGGPIFFDEITATHKMYKDLVNSVVAKQHNENRTPVRVQSTKQTRSLLGQFNLSAPGATKSVPSRDLAELLGVDAVLRTDFVAPLFGKYSADPDAFAKYKRKIHTANVALRASLGLLTGNVFGTARAVGGIVKDVANKESCGERWAEHVPLQNYLCPRAGIITMRLGDSENETLWQSKRDCLSTDARALEKRWNLADRAPENANDDSQESPEPLLPKDTFRIMINDLPYDRIVLRKTL